MKRVTGKVISARQVIITYVMGILILFACFLGAFCMFSLENLHKRVMEANEGTLDLCIGSISANLKYIDQFLLECITNSQNFEQLKDPKDPLDAYLLGSGMTEEFKHVNRYSVLYSGYAVISKENDQYRLLMENLDIRGQEQLKQCLYGKIRENGNYISEGWKYQKIGEDVYLIRCFGDNGNYVFSILNMAKVVDTLFEKENTCDFLFQKADADMPGREGIAAEKQFFIQKEIPGTDVVLWGIFPVPSIWRNLEQNHIFFLMVLGISILLIPITYRLMKVFLKIPFSKVMETLDKVNGVNMSVRMPGDFKIAEFAEVADSFNFMMDEIEELKISVLENKISKQRAELQYLHLQLKPHFFLNCLKNIYGMAESRQYKKIQEMTIEISNYFRYVMEDNLKLIFLKDELNHVRSYIKLRKITNTQNVVGTIDSDEQLMGRKIPPMVIQTFVENSIKHAGGAERTLCINIKVDSVRSREEELIDIIIQDNGPGYPEELIKELNKAEMPGRKENPLFSGTHIGINNVKQRLKLIYGDRAVILFYNNNGACVEIMIPDRTD